MYSKPMYGRPMPIEYGRSSYPGPVEMEPPIIMQRAATGRYSRSSGNMRWCLICIIAVLIILAIVLGVVFGVILPRQQQTQTCGQGYTKISSSSGTGNCIDLDECSGYPPRCPPNQLCNNLPGTYNCQPCPPGQQVSPDGRSCIGGSTCQDSCDYKPNSKCYQTGYGTVQCLCDVNYYEINGQCKLRTKCTDQPCLNGGTCVAYDDQFICQCPKGYSGSVCQTPSSCLTNPCVNGWCVEAYNGRFCQCFEGWSGESCDAAVTPCDSQPCANGVCAVNGDTYTCTCTGEWSGTNCDMVAGPCATAPCLNGGVCQNAHEAYVCSCPVGFMGANCEIESCNPDPCDPMGTVVNGCTAGPGTFTCHCNKGYTGQLCDLKQCGEGFDACVADTDCCAGYYCSGGLCLPTGVTLG